MSTPSHRAHKEQAPAAVVCGIVTVSDTRTPESDSSGALIREQLISHGHEARAYHIVKDDPKEIRRLLDLMLARADLQALIINGGTGIAPRDVTFDVVAGLLQKELPGFGEFFRHFSYEEIGSAALMSRATAGIVNNKVVFSVPGSSGAVELAMKRLILPELSHLVYELNK